MEEVSIEKIEKGRFDPSVGGGDFLVDFYADWCGPCRMMAPHLSSLAKDFIGKIKVVKINIDEDQKTAADYRISSIPTLLLFKKGKEVARLSGLRDYEALKLFVNAHFPST